MLGEQAFSGCSNVNYVYIGNGVADIGTQCFSNCKGELVCNTSIPDTEDPSSTYHSDTSGPFYGSKFSKVTFNDRAVKIGRHAFCTSSGGSGRTIDTLIINESLSVIGANAIGGVKNIFCMSKIPPKGESSMFTSSGLLKLYVPIGSAEAYKTASYWKDYASKIEEYDFENNPI